MPTPEQMEKLAPDVEKDAAKGVVGASDPISEAYWAAVLQDTRAEPQVVPIQNCRLSDIARHVLRVSCRRCDRVVEIQRSDAVRLYGGHTVWKDVGRHSAHVEPYLIIVGAKMAPKYHPTPLSGGDRKALKKELGKSRAMTGILSAQADELRSRGEALLQKSDNLACQSWNERMWSDGEPIDPSPTIN